MKNGKEFWILNSWSWEFAQIPGEVCKTKCLDSAVCTRVAMEHTHKTFGGINLGPINPSTTECWVQKSKNYKWQHMINNSCKTSGIHFQKYIFKNYIFKNYQKLHFQKNICQKWHCQKIIILLLYHTVFVQNKYNTSHHQMEIRRQDQRLFWYWDKVPCIIYIFWLSLDFDSF